MPDLNIRNVDAAVLERLRQQAAAEGVSLSEWVRTALGDRAAAPTAAELAERRAANLEHAQSREEFDRYYHARLHRRSS